MKLRQALARIGHMMTKEFIQTLRDPHTRWILWALPLQSSRC
jgi:hypothetical protein